MRPHGEAAERAAPVPLRTRPPEAEQRRASLVYRGSRVASAARRAAGLPRSHVVVTVDGQGARWPLTVELLTDDACLDDAVKTGLRIGRETVDQQRG